MFEARTHAGHICQQDLSLARPSGRHVFVWSRGRLGAKKMLKPLIVQTSHLSFPFKGPVLFSSSPVETEKSLRICGLNQSMAVNCWRSGCNLVFKTAWVTHASSLRALSNLIQGSALSYHAVTSRIRRPAVLGLTFTSWRPGLNRCAAVMVACFVLWRPLICKQQAQPVDFLVEARV